MTIRTHGQLRDEAGAHPWCGPSAVALITGLTYREVEDAIRARMAKAWCPRRRRQAGRPRLTTTWWDDLIAVCRERGAAMTPTSIDAARDDGAILYALPRATLAGIVGRLSTGWYLARVTNHFLLLRVERGRGAWLFDNVTLTRAGVPAGIRAFGGRRRITHLMQITSGPLLDSPPGDA